MGEKTARLISYLFFPAIIPSYLLTLLFFKAPTTMGVEGFTPFYHLIIIGFVFIYTCLIPSLLIVWLYKRGKVKSIELNDGADRHIPYLVSIIFTAFLAYFFHQKSNVLYATSVMMAGVSLTLLLVFIINIYWQISIHSAAIGGFVGSIFLIMILKDESLLQLPATLSLLIAGLVIWARLKLEAHTPAQAYFGFILGFLISGLAVFFI